MRNLQRISQLRGPWSVVPDWILQVEPINLAAAKGEPRSGESIPPTTGKEKRRPLDAFSHTCLAGDLLQRKLVDAHPGFRNISQQQRTDVTGNRVLRVQRCLGRGSVEAVEL